MQGVNGREWIGPATMTYFMKMLVEDYSKNKELVDTFDWYILPVVNPDGYEYSHTQVSKFKVDELKFTPNERRS
jgi:murein tripeptide amidase MpaA